MNKMGLMKQTQNEYSFNHDMKFVLFLSKCSKLTELNTPLFRSLILLVNVLQNRLLVL